MSRPLVQCPFDSTHVLTEDRLQTHMLKCMRRYPNHVVCPYNALHRFLNVDQLLPHILTCPSRTLVQPWRNRRADHHGDLTEQPFHFDNQRRGDDDDDWESEYQ